MAINNNYTAEVGIKFNDRQLNKQLKDLGSKTVTVNMKLGDGVSRQLNSINKSFNRVTDGTVAWGKSVESSSDKASKSLNTVDKSTKNISKSFYDTSKHADTLGSKFLDITKKVIAFGAVTSLIGLFTKSMSEAIEVTKEFDASLAELRKVSDLSGEGLKDYTEDSFKMARELSTTASTVTDAVALFVQAGYDLEQAKGLAKYSIMLQAISDHSLDAETSAMFLTSTIKAFNLTANDAEKIINSVNETSNKYSITSNDLTENLSKVAGVAGTAGVEFEQLIGLMVSSVEKTKNASKSANAFKSIFINLQQMDSTGTVPKLSKQFDDFGISMTNTNGSIKDAYELLRELSVAYEDAMSGSDVNKQNKMRTLLEDIGGKHNSNILIASLSNFESAISATETAYMSANSAQKEFDKSLDQIAKKADETKGAFLELVWGDGGLKTFLTIVLDITTGTLNLISSLGGLPSILLTILSITSLIKGQSIVLGISKLISAIPMLMTSLKGLQFMYSSVTNSIIVSNQAINLSIPVIGLAIAAISALIMAWNGYNSAQEKRKQTAIENARVLNQEIDGIQSAIDLIKDEKTSREQIVSAVNNVNSAYTDELKAIKDVNDLRQKAIDLLDEEAIKKAKQYTSENLSGYTEALSNKKNGSDSSQKSVLKAYNYSHNTKMPEAIQFGYDDSKLNTEGQIKKFEGIIETIQKTSGYVDKYSKYLGLAENALADLREEQSSTDTVISAFNDNLAIQGLKWDEVKGKIVPMTQAQIDEYNSKLLMKEGAEEFGYALDEESDAMDTNANATQEQIDAHQALMDSTNDVISSMEMLNDASQEQAENGELSAETAMKLIEAGYAGALAFDAETNSVTLDREAMALLLQSKLENQIANLELANSGLADILITEGNAAVVSATGYNILALAKMDAMNAGSSSAGNQFINNQKQIEVLNSKLDDLKTKGTGAFGAVSKGAGGASKSVQTLEDKVKSATNYMKSMIDKEIKALREAKEAEEERIEAEIDALKERREAQEAYWDAKIEKVKKANEILEEQNKLQELEQNLALAKSKKVKVFTGDKFEYKEDVDAVSKASQELSDYKREQQIAKEVETLEKLKKKALDAIDKQIKGWEKYKKEMQKSFDAQIKALENYKDQLDDLTNSYKDQQDKLIAEQLLGAKLEQGNWQLRIDNLKKFVKEYNGELSGIKTDVDTKGTDTKSGSGSKAGMPSNVPAHASGSYAVPTDEIAIVGDSPNRELSIGSKLNMGGVMARLKGGTGVMPNTLTERLVSMAYNTNTSPINNNNGSVININVDKVELPRVTDGMSFVNEIMGIKNLAIQMNTK